MSRFIDQSDDDLANHAATVFRLGLIDGRTRKKPRSSHEIMQAITLSQDDWRIIDRKKYRQVYGAAFDLVTPLKPGELSNAEA